MVSILCLVNVCQWSYSYIVSNVIIACDARGGSKWSTKNNVP